MTSLTKKWKEDKLKYKCRKWEMDKTKLSGDPHDWTFCHHPKEAFIHVCTKLECDFCYPNSAYGGIADEESGDD